MKWTPFVRVFDSWDLSCLKRFFSAKPSGVWNDFCARKDFFFLEKKTNTPRNEALSAHGRSNMSRGCFFYLWMRNASLKLDLSRKSFFLLRHFEYNTSRPKTKETTRKEKEPTCTWHVCKGPGQECVFCLKGRVEFIHGGLDCFVLHSALIKPIDGVKIVNYAHDEIVRKSLSDLIVCLCVFVCVCVCARTG